MAFVNENVSEKDIKQYDLNELLNRYRKPNDMLPKEGFSHYWTIDRSKKAFLVLAKVIERCGASGRLEPTNRRIFVLVFEDAIVEIEAEKLPESSQKYNEKPFKIVWKILGISPEGCTSASDAELEKIAKEAITCFGVDGANWQVANTIVEFKS